ncbi:MAG: hypothetical protein V3T23_11330 [Nitrososphaerales archaeon]
MWESKLIKRAQADPNWFIENALGDKVWSKQAEICDAIVKHERVAVPAAFGVGKTWLAARIALWFLYSFSPAKVISTAPTNRQVKDLLWSELRTAHRKSKVELGGSPLQLSLTLKDDHYAIGFSTQDYDIDKFTGYHSPNQLIVFDQASGLPKTFYNAAEGLMTSANVKWLCISNTATSDGEFANICMPNRKTAYGDWHVIPITALESPNVIAGENIFPGLIAHDWVEKRRKAWGEADPLYKIFVEAKFIDSAEMTVLTAALIDNMEKLNPWYMPGVEEETLEVGIDVARSGLDKTVLSYRQGNQLHRVRSVTGHNNKQIVALLKDENIRIQNRLDTPVTSIKIDVIGFGADVYDRVIDENLPAIAVNNSGAALDNERFLNVRAEMAWSFRDRLDNHEASMKECEIEEDDKERLLADMAAMRYEITTAGKVQIIDKKALKKILGRSPDHWDSVVMAYEQPGGGVGRLEMVSAAATAEAVQQEMEDEGLVDPATRALFGTDIPGDGDFIETDFDQFFTEW